MGRFTEVEAPVCEECSVHKLGPLITALREFLPRLDEDGEHAAAALIDEAIRLLERSAMIS